MSIYSKHWLKSLNAETLRIQSELWNESVRKLHASRAGAKKKTLGPVRFDLFRSQRRFEFSSIKA